MAYATGIVSQLDALFVAAASDPARVQVMIDALPDPDTTSSSGAIQGGGSVPMIGFFDEMSPFAVAQLRVELAALKARIT